MSTELRREALIRAEAMRSPRAAEVLRRSILETHERAANAWESSDGTVRAVDVRALLDGYALGLVRSSPAVHDAVVEAITTTAPRVLDASVVDLELVWALRERGAGERYRDVIAERADRRSSRDVQRALAAYLAASGDDETSRAVESGELVVKGRRTVRVSIAPERVRPALIALLGPDVRIAAIVR